MQRGERGFTYLGLLIAVAILGIGLLAVSEMWSSALRHQRMVQMDWIGGQFAEAIGSYYQSSPGTLKQYPATLAELLEDKRFLTVRRHLRQIYVHPVTGLREWELLRGADGRIVGVRAEVPMPAGPLVREYRWVHS
jgi:type II secretory pathway pseudopilin PulG